MIDPHMQLYRLAVALRALAAVLRNWPLVLAAAFLVSPIGPHVRWPYAHPATHGQRTYAGCVYIGSRGFLVPDHVRGCPFVAWLDSREGEPTW